MKQTFSAEHLAEIYAKLDQSGSSFKIHSASFRSPVHVVYGGANLFKHDTPQKLGSIALRSLETYAPNFAEFARAMWLPGSETLPIYDDAVQNLESELTANEARVKSENFAAWFAWTVYQKTIEKLRSEPVEDFRIDYEDGYGFRPDAEEDSHAITASSELAKSFNDRIITPFCGFRVKSFAPETFRRAVRTLDLFLTNLFEKTDGKLPLNFAVTLPKITRREEVEILANLLSEFERQNNLKNGTIKIEIMIETPQAIVNENGIIALRSLVEAGDERITSAHFGAYDYTASFGISAVYQHLNHEACVYARQMMQIALAPTGIRLVDSVTTEMPVPVHKGEKLTEVQSKENNFNIHKAWRKHFKNVTNSQINGFYQSWDLHPAQLVPRYAAVYSFFLESKDVQAARLRGFIEKATQANLTGNTFDDAASAQGLLNFFTRALNCGAMEEEEILTTIGLSAENLRAASFVKILEQQGIKKSDAHLILLTVR